MELIYQYPSESPREIVRIISHNLNRRRLEKGWSRQTLSRQSGVPERTIARFEQESCISMQSFVALAQALGYTDSLKQLLSEPIYHTMDELDTINSNKNRVRGRRNEKSK